MIIVEGLDNTGKTTLVDNLTATFQLRREKSPGPASLLTHLEWIVNALNDDDTCIIYDRYSVISERVYGPCLRGDSVFRDLSDSLLELTLQKVPLIIYCRPPVEKIVDWGDRTQMSGVKANVQSLLDLYDMEIWRVRRLNKDQNVIRYDYTQPGSLGTVHREVEGHLGNPKKPASPT